MKFVLDFTSCRFFVCLAGPSGWYDSQASIEVQIDSLVVSSSI